MEFKGFRLKDARYYEEIVPTEQGWYWSQQLELYLGIVEERLSFFTLEGKLVLAPQEAALQEQQRAETERQRAEQAEVIAEAERQRAKQAEAKAESLRLRLQELGVDLSE